MNKKILLSDNEKIVSAYAEKCSGPGWCNKVVVIIIRDCAGSFRIEYLQPEEMTPKIAALFDVCAIAHERLLEAIGEINNAKD